MGRVWANLLGKNAVASEATILFIKCLGKEKLEQEVRLMRQRQLRGL